MSSSGRRRFPVRHPAVVDLGCSCRPRTKLSSLFSFPTRKSKSKAKQEPPSSPKNHQHHHHHQHPLSSYYPFSTPSAATSPWETSRHPSSISTTTATSPYVDDEPVPEATAPGITGKGRVGESVAVVKESDDPYLDFRQSMLQMILEKEIYAWEDLQELLTSFLALNSPCHHDVIVRAFTEIWGGDFPSAGRSSYATAGSYAKQQRGNGGGGRPRRRRHLSRDE